MPRAGAHFHEASSGRTLSDRETRHHAVLFDLHGKRNGCSRAELEHVVVPGLVCVAAAALEYFRGRRAIRTEAGDKSGAGTARKLCLQMGAEAGVVLSRLQFVKGVAHG